MASGQDVITGTRTVRDALLTDVNDDIAELHLIKDEVVAARDGEVSLKAQIDALQAALKAQIDALQAALVGVANGAGILVSINDTTPGFLNGKLVGGSDILLTENNNGGNETLSATLKDNNQIADLESQTFFNGLAF
jgi:hypothetical protein